MPSIPLTVENLLFNSIVTMPVGSICKFINFFGVAWHRQAAIYTISSFADGEHVVLIWFPFCWVWVAVSCFRKLSCPPSKDFEKYLKFVYYQTSKVCISASKYWIQAVRLHFIFHKLQRKTPCIYPVKILFDKTTSSCINIVCSQNQE